MHAAQSIDFTRGDIGFWLLWVTIPFLVVFGAWKKLVAGDRRKILKLLGLRLLVGLLLATLIVGLLSVWARRGPQYFVTLRLQGNAVALDFRGSPTKVEIPLRDIKSIAIVKSGTFRHRCNRLQIETSTQSFQIFGFGSLADDQTAVVESLRSQAGRKTDARQP